MASYFTASADKERSTMDVRLEGPWTVAALAGIDEKFSEIAFSGFKSVVIDGTSLADLDTAGAWYLHSLSLRLKSLSVKVELKNFSDASRRIFERISALPLRPPLPVRSIHVLPAIVTGLGRQITEIGRDARRGVRFLGQFIASLTSNLRLRSVIFHVNEAGLKAVPIIALMGFSLAFVTAYQGAYQLQKFDATIFTIDLVVLSTLRELGVLMVAIMLAGRSGSAFAAQLGTMKLNEEVDALQTMGVSPFQVLVMPRLIAILIALPLLTVIADMMGLLGGYVYMSSFLGYSWLSYVSRLHEAGDITHLYVGLSKAPFFALLIGIVGCMHGLRASVSAEEVGRRTITAVVQSIFLVVAADALFSIVFTKMGV